MRVLKHRGSNKIGDMEKNVGSGAMIKDICFSTDSKYVFTSGVNSQGYIMMHSIIDKVCISKLKVVPDLTHELSRNPTRSKRHFLNNMANHNNRRNEEEDLN